MDEINESKDSTNTIVVKEKSNILKWVIIAIAIIIGIVIGISVISKTNKTVPKQEVFMQFLRAEEISQLRLIKNTMNGIVTSTETDEDGKTIVNFVVRYEGTAILGVDFNDIKIKVNKGKKVIEFILPEIEIIDIDLDEGSLRFMRERKGLKEKLPIALNLCKQDIQNEVEKNPQIYQLAKDNLVKVVQGLCGDYVKDIYPSYSIEVK